MRITLSECPNTSFKIRSLLKNQLEGKVITKKLAWNPKHDNSSAHAQHIYLKLILKLK